MPYIFTYLGMLTVSFLITLFLDPFSLKEEGEIGTTPYFLVKALSGLSYFIAFVAIFFMLMSLVNTFGILLTEWWFYLIISSILAFAWVELSRFFADLYKSFLKNNNKK